MGFNSPPKSPASRVNFPLIYFLTVALTYPDDKLACEFPKGLPLVGKIAECNALTAKPRGAPLPLETWKRGLPARNAKIVETLKRAAGAELALERWNKTMAEVQKGRVSTPQPISKEVGKSIPLPPLFAIREHRGTATKEKDSPYR